MPSFVVSKKYFDRLLNEVMLRQLLNKPAQDFALVGCFPSYVKRIDRYRVFYRQRNQSALFKQMLNPVSR